MGYSLVVVGASAGGLHALSTILGRLPAEFSASLAIVQHRRPDDTSLLRDLLARKSRLPVVEPCHGEPIVAGHVYLAPANYHLLVEPGSIALSIDAPVRCSRPSMDLLFESAAMAYREKALGVVLTGANADGAIGAAALAAVGAPVIVQDPRSAESPTCPQATLERVPSALVLHLDEIAQRLIDMCGRSPGM
jgi:two-component system chemotaxis response regulator CheB